MKLDNEHALLFETRHLFQNFSMMMFVLLLADAA
jgi:hypothetical protein